MDTWKQYFNHTFTQINDISVTGPEGEDVVVIALTYNPATPAEGITAPLIDTPVDDARGSACFEDQWEGIDATGHLALVKRGTCPIADKLKLAKAHGALGVILYNNSPGDAITAATLGRENIGLLPPVGTIPLEVGEGWSARLRNGEELVVKLYVDAVFEERETWNVISETKEGDPNNVIVLGAHLDSVQAGPGINDDGSGTTLILELAKALQHFSTNLKVRFGWWGAEENGLWGSRYYVEDLTPAEVDDLLLYLNFDMVSRGYFGVFDGAGDDAGPGGAPGSEVITQLFTDHFHAQGIETTPIGLTGGTDYVPFMTEINKPVGGLFTGASAAEDDCYHQACDHIGNPDPETLTINAKAAAHVLSILAQEGAELIPKGNSTIGSIRRSSDPSQVFNFGAHHGKYCDHDII